MLVESFLVDPNSLPLLQEWALPFELNRRDGPTSFEIVAGDFKDGILGRTLKLKTVSGFIVLSRSYCYWRKKCG